MGTRRMWGAVLMAAVALASAHAQPSASEAAVKAAYLYKFLAYVEWPPSALPSSDAPLVVGVAGADAVFAELQGVIAGRQVNGHPVSARRLKEGDSLDGLHMAFVGPRPGAARLIEQLRSRPVLVVTETGLASGGMLNFVAVDGRLRFEASPLAAERAGIKLSARLLGVAERVVSP
jgi:hypothetical protein